MSTIEFADPCGDDGQTASRTYTIASSSTGFSTSNGRFGSIGVSISSNGNFWGHGSRATGGGLVVAASVSISTGRLPVLCFYDSAAASPGVQVQISVTAAGEIVAWRGQESTELGRTAAGVVTPASRNHYEAEVTINSTTGTVTVWLNGASSAVLTLTGKNTQATTNATYNVTGYGYFSSGFPGISSAQYDDFIVRSGSGQLGDARCIYSAATVAGTNADWTPLSSTNVSNINETNPNDDTSYNSTLTVNAIDSFTSAALPSGLTTILAVCPTFYARKDDASSHTLASYLKSSSATSVGTAKSLIATYARFQEIVALDPNTTAAWTVSGANAAERGYKLIS